MTTDVIISCFATPPKRKEREIAQPQWAFRDAPHMIDINGIGSNQFRASFDTESKPREPWGGRPFAREAEKFKRKGGDSILRGVLKSRARGIDVGRVALVAFSAGGTFVGKVLANAVDAEQIDTVIMLDALHLPKIPGQGFYAPAVKPWAKFAARALAAGIKEDPYNPRAPFFGPSFIMSHTAIVQDAKKERIVGNTTDSARAVRSAMYGELEKLVPGRQSIAIDRRVKVNLSELTKGPPSASDPVKIGPPRIPPPSRTWNEAPMPKLEASWGNFYSLDYGGRTAADHVYQAWYAQGAIWRAFLAPRWNAEVTSPYSVSGFEACCPGPGGNFATPGVYPTGAPLWLGAVGLAAGFSAALALSAMR